MMVFVASILATLVFWTILPARFLINESTDYKTFYEPVARNILAGHGFVLENGDPAIRYPAGYPVLLAGVFGLSGVLKIPEDVLLSAFILFNMGLTSVFVFWLARSVWGPRAAVISAFVWMTYPCALWLMKQPNSEIPFMPFLLGGFYLFWSAVQRKRHAWILYFLSGLLVGFAMLIRPIAIGSGAVMGVILWVICRDMQARSRVFLITMMLLGNFVVIFPWEAWIHLNTGKIVLLADIGHSSLTRGATFDAFPETYRQVFSEDISFLMEDIEARLSEAKSSGGFLSVLVDELRTHPLAMAKLYGLKSLRSWYGTDSGRYEALVILIQVPYLVILVWGSYGAWRQGGTARQLTVSIWLIVLYFWGISTLGISMARYMVPAMGLWMAVIPGLLTRRLERSPFIIDTWNALDYRK